MRIRTAEKKDIVKILDLLSQVLELHARIRRDIFIPGTTKYSEQELIDILQAEDRLTYVAVDDSDNVLGYAFCIIKQNNSANTIPFFMLFIDDFCVDASKRGQHIGQALFDFVKEQATKLGCYEIALNVWEGNDNAKSFYDKMGMKPKSTIMEYIL